MKKNPRNDLNFRLEAVHSAQKIGVAKTAGIFNLTRDTVYRWLKRYQESGLEGLTNKSRLEQQHPRKLSSSTRAEISALQNSEPGITLQNIIERLRLNCSVSTISKFLSRQKTPAVSLLKKQIPAFNYFYLNIEKIADASSQLPCYLLQLKELTSGITFYGLSAENSPNSIGVFCDWLLTHLQSCITLDKLTIFTCKGRFSNSRGVKESLFDTVVKQKFMGRITICGEKLKLEKELFNLVLNQQESSTETFRSLFFNRMVQNNLAKIPQITDWQRKLILLPPLLIDRHLGSVQNIFTNSTYWLSYNDSKELLPALFDYLFNELAANSQSKGDLTALTAFSELFLLLELSGYHDQSQETKFLLSFSEALDRCGEWKKAEQIVLKILDSVHFNSSNSEYNELKALEFIAGINEKNGRYLQAAQYYKKAISVLNAATQTTKQIELLKKTAFCYQSCGEFKQAVSCFRRIASFSGADNHYLAAKGIAGVYYAKGNYLHANKLLRKLLTITQSGIDYIQKSAEICGELGCTYLYLRDYSTAEFYISRQLEYLEQLALDENYFHTRGVLGITKYYLNKQSEGDLCFADYTGYLTAMADQTTDNLNKIINWSEIAGIKKVAADYEGAILYIKKANLLAKQIENLNKLAFGYLMLGCIYQEMGKFSKALKYFRLVLEISEQQKEFRVDFFATYNIATTYYQLQDKVNAQIWYAKVLEIAGESENLQAQLDCCKQLALLAYEEQNYLKSIANCRNYLALSASSVNKDQAAVYHCLGNALLRVSADSSDESEIENCYSAAARIYAKNLQKRELCHVIYDQACFYRQTGSIQNAEMLRKKGLRLAKVLKDAQMEAKFLGIALCSPNNPKNFSTKTFPF